MSYFPGQDRSREPMDEWQTYPFCQPHSAASATRTSRDQNTFDNTRWSATEPSIQDPYATSQPMPWSSEPLRGLGMDSLNTPTQTMFDSSYPTCNDFAVPASWPCPTGSLLTPSIQQDTARYHSALEQWYTPPPAITTSAAWTTIPAHATSFNPGCETSPRHSNYSMSSASSVVASSPYAHSEGCLQPASPPAIKQEDSAERSKDRLYSVPGLASFAQLSHIDPGDVYTSPPLGAAEQTTFSGVFGNTKVEVDDEKPFLHQGGLSSRRATSVEDALSSGSDSRVKRGFTTHANSTCECDKCGKLFQRSYNLKAHMETHDPEREQAHACPYHECKRRFVRRTDLIRHEQSVHLKARNFHCPLCFSAFARKDTLRRHVDDGCPRREQVRRRDRTKGTSTASQASIMIPKTEPY